MSKKITKLALTRLSTSIGGVEIYSANFTKAIKRFFPGSEVYFVTNLLLLAKEVENAGGKAYVLPVFAEEVGTKRGLARLILALPKYLFYFLQTAFILRFKKDVKIAVFQGTTEKITLSPILKILGFRVIWLEHGPFFTKTKAKEIKWLYRLKSVFANKIITVSDQARQNLLENGVNPAKVVSVFNGIDTKYFAPLAFSEKQEKIIGFIGAIVKEKGIEDFLAVVKKLQATGGKYKFILVGGGQMINKVKGEGKDFFLPGFVKDIRSYLGIFDLFFFPTRHQEGLSAALQQAMAMGVPVVARDIGGNRELVVHGKTGYLFKDETPEELANVIVDLLKDKKKRKAMGKAARERIVKHFNMEKWVTELYSVFEEVARK